MAITEKFESRRTREFPQGTNMTRVFHMTHTDYNDVFDIFIGNALGASVEDSDFPTNSRNLRVIDVDQVAIDNVYTLAIVKYSSQNTPNIEAIPDASNSWIETFGISPVDESVNTYIDQGNFNVIDWPTDWADFKPEGASDTVPELIIRNSHIVFNVTAWASTLYFERILLSLNRINGVNFLNNYFGFGPQADIDTDININDFDQWLFSACPITRVAKNTWRYDFTFEYSGDKVFGWNEVESLQVTRYNNKAPGTSNFFNFVDLFNGMDNVINTDVSLDTGR